MTHYIFLFNIKHSLTPSLVRPRSRDRKSTLLGKPLPHSSVLEDEPHIHCSLLPFPAISTTQASNSFITPCGFNDSIQYAC